MGMLKRGLRKWLEVPSPAETKINDKLSKEVATLNRDLTFWRSEFKKRQPKKKCTKCGQPINLWPFEDDGYYLKGSRVTHLDCGKEGYKQL